MSEIRIPLPGDVLFFKSSKIHGRAIARAQKRLGFVHYEYMHVALCLGGDLIMESTTKYGVRKVRLSSYKNPADYLTATVLRRSSSSSLLVQGELQELSKSAYYYYKEAYDWRALVQRQAYAEGKSICSVFVKKALLRSKQVQDAAFAGYGEQIYPAELYSALIAAGYRLLEDGYNQDNWMSFASAGDVVDVFEYGRLRSKQIDKLNATLYPFFQKMNTMLTETVDVDSPDLFTCVSVFAATDRSVLQAIDDHFNEALYYLDQLDRKVKGGPINWRDRSQYRDTLLLLLDTTTSHCRTTMKLVGALTRMVPSNSMKEQFSLLQNSMKGMNEQNLEEAAVNLFAVITRNIFEVFLVTRTSSLDDLDAAIAASRVKLQAYQKAVSTLDTVNQFGFPTLDDQYESAINFLAVYLKSFRKYESSLGKDKVAEIADVSRRAAEKAIKAMPGIDDLMKA
jgi:hypothetical protein